MTFNKDKQWNFNLKLKLVVNDSLFGPGVIRIMELVKETNSPKPTGSWACLPAKVKIIKIRKKNWVFHCLIL